MFLVTLDRISELFKNEKIQLQAEAVLKSKPVLKLIAMAWGILLLMVATAAHCSARHVHPHALMRVGEILIRNGLTDDRLLEYFKNAERDILDIIEKLDPDSPYRSYRYQQRIAIEIIIKRLEQKIGRWTEKVIPDLVAAGAKEVAEQIKEFDEKEWALKFSGVNETAVAVLADSALADFGNTIVALKKNAQRAAFDKKKLNDKIVEGIIQGSSVYRTERQLLDGLRKQELSCSRPRMASDVGSSPKATRTPWSVLSRSRPTPTALGCNCSVWAAASRRFRNCVRTSTAQSSAMSGKRRSTST